jgi:hypothetical protein
MRRFIYEKSGFVRLGGGEQGLVETFSGKPSYLNEIQMGEESDCSLQGSLRGGVWGVRPDNPRI